jgi:serine/threonine-protein kinase
MKSSSSPVASADSLANGAHSEIRQRYLAACEASQDGSRPDIDSFVAGIEEPERSQLRSELAALGTVKSSGPDTATVDHLPAPGATDRPTLDDRGAATMDLAPADPSRTVDHPSEASGEAGSSAALESAAIAGYDILGVLGRGAMGVVYKAKQRGLNRSVALKMILAGGHASAHELARFRSEAESVAQLQHPNIVQIYAVGESDGRPYFSLEYVEGTTLDRKVRDNPLPPREAAQICKLLASAMDYAHQRGIIHRDLKPSNVLVANDGTPKISDFGLAKRIAEEDSGVTRAGTVLGTPSYMAPEQAEGKNNQLGPRSDIYSLGAVLYDLLTGRAPFRGTTMLDTLDQVRTREPVPPLQLAPSTPRDLETICLKCLQKDPARRYQTGGELAADLERFLKGEPILARPVGRVERTWRWCKRNPRSAVLVAAVVLLVVGWGASASGLAWSLDIQKGIADGKTEEARKQTKIAEQQTDEAKKQTKIAKDERDNANTQKAIAEKQTVIAKEQKNLAEKREESARGTAQVTVQGMIGLGDSIFQGLRPKRVSAMSDAEARRVREDLLARLRKSLDDVTKKIDKAGGTTFAEAGACIQLGELLVKLGQSEEAIKMYTRARDNLQAIADKDPKFDQARGNLCVPLLKLGEAAIDLRGDAKTASENFVHARSLYQELLDHPIDGSYVAGSRLKVKELQPKVHLAAVDLALGNAYLSLGDPAKARDQFRTCLQYRKDWTEGEPKSGEAGANLMQAQMSLGIAASFLGDEKAMRDHFAASLATGDRLTALDSQAITIKLYIGMVKGAYGDALLRAGAVDDAFTNYDDAFQRVSFFISKIPEDNLSQHPLLAQCHERLGTVYARQGKKAESAKHYQEALKLRQDLLQIETNVLSRQAAYLVALAHAGKHAEASGWVQKIGSRMVHSTELQMQMARCLAICAAHDGGEKSKHVPAAVKYVQDATRAKAYKNVVLLETDPDLESLRPVAEFQAVVAQVKVR